MKPHSFDYVRAKSLSDVFAVLDDLGDEARILAGGQSLVPAMNFRLATPATVVDIRKISELLGISVAGDLLSIGACNRHVDLLRSSDVARCAPLIAGAMPHIAHPAIRNRGTIGGSLCTADPASELPACTIALNARFTLQSSRGKRVVNAKDFFEGTYATCLEPNEVLVSVDIPAAKATQHSYFDELARRQGDYALAGIAASCEVQDGRFIDANLVYFAVSEMPLRASVASDLLRGQVVCDVDMDAVCSVLADDVAAFDDLATSASTKLHWMKVLTRRALAALGVNSAQGKIA